MDHRYENTRHMAVAAGEDPLLARVQCSSVVTSKYSALINVFSGIVFQGQFIRETVRFFSVVPISLE